jgi:uncharacterized protein YdaU (DUF1376 family)
MFFSVTMTEKRKVVMHYYQFHIGDYKSHTHHLSLIEDIAYRRLLDHYYLHEEPIKQREIARQIGMRDYEQDVLSVLDEFFVSTENGYISPRADKEIEHFHSKVEQATRAGKASAEQRLNRRTTDVQQESNARSTDVQPTNNHKPITINHKPEREKKATVVACPLTVEQQVWSDWLQIRKAKGLPMTETAWSQIQNEFRKSNLSDQQGIEYCCLSNWAAFKTAWYEKNMQEQKSGLSKQGQVNQNVMSGLTRGLIKGDGNVKLLGS